MNQANIDNSNPLVSIIVITYNSSKYVLETLESARLQTYQNIELIVSDDCSADKTTEICRNWIEENKERFVRTELVTVDKNTGISSNCNRGLYASKGEWIKLIAGDDVLSHNCIYEFEKYSKTIDSKSIPCCGVQMFGESSQYFCPSKYYNNSSAKKQFRILLKHNTGTILLGPSYFIKKGTLESFGGYDERFPMWEDFPFFLNATKNGYKFLFIDKPLIHYRVSRSSVCNERSANFLKSEISLYNELWIPYMKMEKLYLYLWHYYLAKFVKKNKIGILRFLLYSTDPIKLWRYFQKN
jgi:alpha-1,3-rhamnosyltransferase